MQKHPFNAYIPYRIVGICLTVLAWAVYVSFLVLYGREEWKMAWVDGLLSVGILAVAGYQLWYVTGVLRAVQAQGILALLVQAICIGNSYIFLSLMPDEPGLPFITSVPLRLALGLSCWVILLQWYRFVQLREEDINDRIPEKEEELPEVAPLPSEETYMDRISVKDGARIHLIHPEEVFYIQASGDYVTLFTAEGQYVKEQTMKFFELHLPPDLFVRIHRSCIVNVEQIVRVELFGKENYQVRLKNGISLRASLSGYKVLKKRLSL